jgi:hypothetical protein
MSTTRSSNNDRELHAVLARAALPGADRIAARVRATSYPVRTRRLPLAAGGAVALVAAIGLIVSLVTTGGATVRRGSWDLVSYVGTPAWQAAESKGFHQGSNLLCPTVSTCYALDTTSRLGPVEIEATHNSGRTWQQTTFPDHTTLAVASFGPYSMACSGNQDCSTMGHNHTGLVFLTTTNGGHTWNSYRGPRARFGPFVDSYACSSPTTCLALSSEGKHDPEVAFTTTTGWKTWARHPMSGSFAPRAATCSSDDRCISVGNLGRSVHNIVPSEAFYSNNGGVSWHQSALPTGSVQTSMACTAGNCMTVADVTTPRITVSSDAGRSWTLERAHGLPLLVGPLACATPTHCWAAGGHMEFSSGHWAIKLHLLQTTDRGRQWQTYPLPATSHISDVLSLSCPSTTTCYAIAVHAGAHVRQVLLRHAT